MVLGFSVGGYLYHHIDTTPDGPRPPMDRMARMATVAGRALFFAAFKCFYLYHCVFLFISLCVFIYINAGLFKKLVPIRFSRWFCACVGNADSPDACIPLKSAESPSTF